jgi:hypothetical protein
MPKVLKALVLNFLLLVTMNVSSMPTSSAGEVIKPILKAIEFQQKSVTVGNPLNLTIYAELKGVEVSSVFVALTYSRSVNENFDINRHDMVCMFSSSRGPKIKPLETGQVNQEIPVECYPSRRLASGSWKVTEVSMSYWTCRVEITNCPNDQHNSSSVSMDNLTMAKQSSINIFDEASLIPIPIKNVLIDANSITFYYLGNGFIGQVPDMTCQFFTTFGELTGDLSLNHYEDTPIRIIDIPENTKVELLQKCSGANGLTGSRLYTFTTKSGTKSVVQESIQLNLPSLKIPKKSYNLQIQLPRTEVCSARISYYSPITKKFESEYGTKSVFPDGVLDFEISYDKYMAKRYNPSFAKLQIDCGVGGKKNFKLNFVDPKKFIAPIPLVPTSSREMKESPNSGIDKKSNPLPVITPKPGRSCNLMVAGVCRG